LSAEVFAMVRRDELWVRGALDESRFTQGQALTRGREIFARDSIDDRTLREKLRAACDVEADRFHRSIESLKNARVRGIVTAATVGLESTITITVGGISVVTTPVDAMSDYIALERLLRPPGPLTPSLSPRRGERVQGEGRPTPIVWRNGSAAVLLHEAIGHAAEHAHTPLRWPRWLRARDITRDGRSADLIAGEAPIAIRRESFRDVPLRRMTNLVFEQLRAPFAKPARRIEVFLVSGGTYEPLTETISIDVATADLVRGKRRVRLAPFTIRASRAAIARALIGAKGKPVRYPGVICSREGQELFVGSYAPVMLTAGLA